MDESVEGQPIPPAGVEVLHADPWVALGLHLTPEEKGLLGCTHLTALILYRGGARAHTHTHKL